MNKHNSRITWGDNLNGLCLGISVDKNQYNRDEKNILLEIFIVNISTKIIHIIERHILMEYDIELRAEDGRRIPMTPKGEKIRRAARTLEPSRTTIADIEPRGIHKVDWMVRLDEWFHLDEPGIYSVQVRRSDWQWEEGILTSGVSIFKITKKGDKL